MDCERARYSLERNDKSAATFWSQQCVEKALKAYALFKRRRAHGHNIRRLHELVGYDDLGLSSSDWEKAYALTRYYVLSRYPNVAGALPEEIITADEAREAVDLALRILARVKRAMGIEDG